MGMIGSIGKFLGGMNDAGTDGLSFADKLNALGMTMQNEGPAAQKLLAGKRSAYATDQFGKKLSGMIGAQYQNGPDPTVNVPKVGMSAPEDVNLGGAMPAPEPAPSQPYHYQPPVKISDGLNANSPELPGLIMQAQKAGYNMDDLIKVFQMQQPDVSYVDGYGFNKKTGATVGGYHPSVEKGQEPVFDGSGHVIGVRNVDGAVQSSADMAGAVQDAQERAKAAYDLPQIQQSDGSTRTIPRLKAVQMLGGGMGGGQGGGMPGGGSTAGGVELGVSQTPAAASAAKIRGDARATAQVDMPGRFNAIDNSIDIATRLRNDPVLAKRTGAWAMLPALPGTHGVAWDAMKKQLLGQVFMDSYSELKGGGQITEVEGAKATQAKARLEAAQTPDDFKAALDDYIGALNRGKALMANKAGGGGSASSSPGRAAIEAEMRRRGMIR